MRSFIALLCILTLFSARAEDQIKTHLPFDAAKITPPDPTKGTPLLRFFNEYLYVADGSELDAEALGNVESFLLSRLFARLRAQEKIDVTPDEIAHFLDATFHVDLAQNKELNDEEKAVLRKIAETSITAWKVDGLLFKRYGGTVVQTKTAPFYPLEAYSDLFSDLTQTKVLEVFNTELREKLAPTLLTENQHVIAPDKIDFKTPWWDKLAAEKKEADEKEQRRAAFNPDKIPPPDPTKGKPIARVLNDYLYAQDLNGKSPAKDAKANQKLSEFIIPPLASRLIKQENIEPDGDEVNKCVRFFSDDKTASLAPRSKPDYPHVTKMLTELPDNVLLRLRFEDVPGAIEKIAAEGMPQFENKMHSTLCQNLVSEWKLGRLLYKRYGGTVIFQQSNPSEPVGAYRKFLEQMEREKAFEIFDKADRAAFYKYYVREDHPMKLAAEEIDFDTPWWEKPNVKAEK